MKKKVLFSIIVLLMFPIIVFATNYNSGVMSGSNVNICTRYQDSSIHTDGDTYFSHCMEAKCVNNNYKIYYYNNNKVTCSNDNTDPYYMVINNSACNKLSSSVCTNGQISYCSMVMYYDCGRTSNGDVYNNPYTTTTTTTTRPRTQIYTTTTTIATEATTKAKSNTKLSSITLSTGTIKFKKNVYEYDLDVASSVNSINVSAIPEDNTSTVKVEGNTDLKNGSVIKIIVTGTDGSKSEYKIKIKKQEEKKLSSNSKLKSLIIRNYEINFNSNITDYVVVVNQNTTELDIYEYIAEDENAKVSIEGNTNLKNNSIIKIVVTAEDGTSTTTYNITVKVQKKSNLLKVLFIIILILAILAGAYYLYKKFVLSKTGDKYEYE